MDDWKLEPARDLELEGLERSRSLQRESGLLESGVRLLLWSAVKVGFRLWNRLEIHGRENLPATPSFVFSANHASHLDALVLGAALPLAWRDVVFPIAAGDVFFQHRGLAAFATACLNALPIWRRKTGAHEMQQLKQRLTQPPCVYILFPEGARTRTGQMLRFKSGVGRLVAGTTVPVVPAYLRGTFEAGPAGAVFPRPYKIVLRIGKPIDCSGVADESNGWKEVARRVEEEIYRLGGLTLPARECGEGTEDPGLAS